MSSALCSHRDCKPCSTVKSAHLDVANRNETTAPILERKMSPSGGMGIPIELFANAVAASRIDLQHQLLRLVTYSDLHQLYGLPV
jgi:hypothetical protein